MSTPTGKEAPTMPAPGPPEPAHVDDLLDAALADTFPASDPVSGLTASVRVGDEGRQTTGQDGVRRIR